MPANAIMLIKVKSKVDEIFLDDVRREFLTWFKMDAADFYSKRAFVRLGTRDELIPIQDDEGTWLNMNFALRYFGEGYKKGNFEFFDICAEWIEKTFNDCEIWYGSDDNYASIRRFDPDKRKKLLEEYRELNPEDIFTRRLRST